MCQVINYLYQLKHFLLYSISDQVATIFTMVREGKYNACVRMGYVSRRKFIHFEHGIEIPFEHPCHEQFIHRRTPS